MSCDKHVKPAAVKPQPVRRRLGPLWALLATIVVPMLAALVLYFNQDWLPQASTNRGALIQPPRPLADRLLARADGGELALNALHNLWVVVAIADPGCTTACRQRVHDLHQIRLAIGKDQERVERLLWFTGAPEDSVIAGLREDYPELTLARHAAGTAGIADALPAAARPGEIYLIDPFGNLMMRYLADSPADDVLKDLKRLLRISKDWQ